MKVDIRRVWGQVARCWKYLTGGGVGVASFASRARPSRGRSARFVRVVGRPGDGSRVRPFSRVWCDLVHCVGCLRFWPRQRPAAVHPASSGLRSMRRPTIWTEARRGVCRRTAPHGQGKGRANAGLGTRPPITPRCIRPGHVPRCIRPGQWAPVYTPPGHNPRTCAPGAYAPGQCRPHERCGVHTARGIVGRPYHGPGGR